MELLNLSSLLASNPYPGRGIMLGRSADNKKAVAAYFIMGRSENSRNRIFEATEDGIRTRAFDESKMTDPSLIIYHPVRVVDGTTIVTNGDQTDTIADSFRRGEGFVRALRTRDFEPDGPNYTPRISGMVRPGGAYRLSILKSTGGDPSCCQRFFYEYDSPIAGQGHFISTYRTDGSPLPSFEGEPIPVALDSACPACLADKLWESLNADNKVSLYVSFIDLATGAAETVIKNKHV
ncbi:IMP cyclohydrolase [Lawsonibacter faecis]|uniref:IMP cyclohydrolase n=1 Tax=Lawsonibacter faecis TaxID=2763052 RepID=A0A8J6MDI8_9FIRM|nr:MULTISPECIES: IMP cyclohydrolase [Oscillospiraceae]MTQ98115.1 inosine monophosphate cyclohydrolase [Pseudoflavonifractor sp. BIOML-A16]MTR07539.1 inosine monophosphate cyclohydrolase [Pseudoflavonifractor sp. BIOML-A15]MTR74441.1 inosine monophosphate cyclohydrolase [Pseudoflavonifractor sp. BIOML-A18]MTS64632.1 inosine monophosphate cyclohydrolase [Pseudoflavonifractor sp. BIOML-A5]MTS72573.1 inosine monophosphate cyclohydrolase [Pseudoflavonifractor sp. BIOML-A8]MTS90774.1 inosine monoph